MGLIMGVASAGGPSASLCDRVFSSLNHELSFLNEAEITQWKNAFKQKNYREIKEYICNLRNAINLFGKNQLSILEWKTVKTDESDFVVGATTILLYTLTAESLSSIYGNRVFTCR